ncbi:MAG: elongation factor P [Bacteroidetes bacterium]|nr:elongation factor P [Bacteroidota bacterium]
MSTTQDIGNGSVIRYNGDLCQITELQHRTPGNKRAFVQVRMRNLRTGKMLDQRFRSGEEVEVARLEYKMMQYLYEDGANLVCMDPATYEQIYVPKTLFGEGTKFLKEGMEVKIGIESETPIYAEPPTFVEVEIIRTEPGVRGNTATNAMKPATVETGATVNVPLFVNQGDKIRIDTRTSEYVERVK